MRLESLFDHPQSLPSVPRIVQELIESFDSELISFKDLAPKLASDPVLSARLLRLANSAYYHVSRPIGTVDDALTMLGFGAVRTLVISSGLTQGFRNVPGLDLHRFWRFSLKVAGVSRTLAKMAHQNAEVAFTVGLMHSIGQLVMHTRMPEQMQQVSRLVDAFDPMRFDVERRTFGYTYADVGAELAKRWRFPPGFAAAIAGFADPLALDPFEPMAGILHLAVWRTRAEELNLSTEDLAAGLPGFVADQLTLGMDELMSMPSPTALCEGLETLVD
ncbi:MAG: HDOD domain-containing protein [Xanthomonadales bacterium]|nr:HDOD domain-containing protein [Xanthomonadales bacterium]HRD72316.1 HDOD domain-containing protein [Aquimonas sp.]